MASTEGAEPSRERRGWALSLASPLALAGGGVMLAGAVLVCVSVLLRWATSRSVPGDFEWVQLCVALAAFAFLPLCQLRRGNIFVDTFTSRLPAAAIRFLDSLWDLVYALFAGLIAWRLAVGALETIGNKTTSMVLGLPIGWAIAASAVMVAFLTLIALITAWRGGSDGSSA